MRLTTVALILLWSVPAWGSVTGYTYLVSKFTNPEQLTVSALPPADGTQGIRIVLDGSTVEDCATGGADPGEVVLCLDTGVWTAVGSGAGGDITAVGDCTTGDCFQAITARHAFLGPVGGGVASFRAITEDDIADLSHTVDTDGQVATEVPYDPTTPADWTDPDPTDVGVGLDQLSLRITTDEGVLSTHSGDANAHHVQTVDTGPSPDCAGDLTYQDGEGECDTYTLTGDTTELSTWSGTKTSGNCVEVDASGNLVNASGACGGASPAGSGSEVQYRASATTLAAVTNSSVSGGEITLGDPLNLGTAISDANRLILTGGSRIRWEPDGGRDSHIRGHSSNRSLILGNAGVDRIGIDASGDVVVDDSSAIYWTTGALPSGDGDAGLIRDSVGVVRVTTGTVGTGSILYARGIASPSVVICADSGDANPSFVVITPTTSFVQLTNSDSDSCDVSLSETGASNGQSLEIALVSNAGGTANFSDSAGVQETGAGCSLSLWGVTTFRYSGDRWVLTNCTPSN